MRIFVLLQIQKNQPVNCVGVFSGSHAALSSIPSGRENQFVVIEHILNEPTKIIPKCLKCNDTGLIRGHLAEENDESYYLDCPNGCEVD